MPNLAGKNIVFEDLIAKGENPGGLTVHAPSGTLRPHKDGVYGADGCQYNWDGGADGQRWNHNPIACEPSPGEMIPSMLPISRKLKK
jgi:hypothetical protein